jgi:predicted glutamine amidotransferase
VAWREGGRVRWQKNLSTGELIALLKKLEGEVVIHFRWASVGGVDARLCHPFPVTPKSSVSLSGMAESVLFHNGTWSGYVDALMRLEQHRKEPLPTSPMSDTRAAALVVHTTGPDALNKLPGRWVWMNAKETQLYGAWEDWRGMQVSNTHFVPRLKTAQARRKATQPADHLPRHQSCLFAC